MPMKLSQILRVDVGLFPADISTLKTGSYIDVSGAQRLLAAVLTASVLATRTVTAQFMQATDTSGSNAKVLGAPVTLTAPTGNGPLAPIVEAQISDLDDNNGFSCVAVQLVSNNGSAVQASAVLLLGDNRFNP